MARETGLQFTLEADGLKGVQVIEFQGREGLSRDFEYQIRLASRKPSYAPDAVVDKAAQLNIFQDGELKHQVHGIVSAFVQSDSGSFHSIYEITLVPEFRRLSLRQNSRIFQKKTAKEIISALLGEAALDNYAFSLKREPAVREYCVQYRESDQAFIERLAAEEGIFHYFTYAKGKHTLMFSDDTQTLSSQGPVLYNSSPGAIVPEPFIRTFKRQSEVRPSSVVMKDYSFKKPAYSFLQEHQGTEMNYQRGSYEHYDYPGRYKDDGSGKPFTRFRLEHLRSEALSAEGQSNQPILLPGMKFDMKEHQDGACNRDWLTIEVWHRGEQPQALEEMGGEGQTRYNNRFRVIPGNRPWRPLPNPKPRVDGPQIATVTGPAGEEIFCDEHGRVKVQFPWDREGQSDDKSSCWIRVSQGWAGGNYGMITIPRIGHEVVVSFLEGDPDQPLITGRTYHASNITPYVLPAHKTRSVLRSDTHKGEGFNEIRIEDEASREQIYVHSQKDTDMVTNNIRRDSIGVDEHHTVGRDSYELVQQHSHRTIGKDDYEDIGQDQHQKIGRNLVQRIMMSVRRFVGGGVITQIDGAKQTLLGGNEEKIIGASQRIKVNKDSYLKATEIVLEAGQEFTVKGPGGFIKIDGGGITICGNVVKINEGGSPGKGTAPEEVKPDEPVKPTRPEEPDRR